jgi:pyruvate dehydrogenase complex dehydrogenase (E1) component
LWPDPHGFASFGHCRRHGVGQPRRIRESAGGVPPVGAEGRVCRREDPIGAKWTGHAASQHIELGIAEPNLFLMLAALGLAAPGFGIRLMPIGAAMIRSSRELDALNYGCYQDSRFLLVRT